MMHKLNAWCMRHKVALFITASIAIVFLLFHIWLHLTNPYASWNIVQSPYTTTVQDGKISYHKNFDLHVTSGALASWLGYYKSGFLIAQNTYFGSREAPSKTADGIIDDIHKLRFDPSKPYLISGDQFSVLYPRNLGVFYNSLLNPNTAHSQQDWENRQRIYLQSTLYAIDAFTRAKTLTTTIVPISPRGVVLTQVHPGSTPSDTLYGILYALQTMQDTARYPNTSYPLQTVDAARQITNERRRDLLQLLDVYLDSVRDPQTGLVKKDIHLAGARDGALRQSSFYDNVILWKTLSLADQLGIKQTDRSILQDMRNKILADYWDDIEGHFKDDFSNHSANANYSSDWLIALPTGFLNPAVATDRTLLERSIAFIHDQQLATPFPIKYTVASDVQAPWAVRTFVPNYGGDAIWSYWGAQYITLLGQLYQAGETSYKPEAEQAIATYRQKIVETHGFPETFTADGKFLSNIVYKSIRQTGWVVQFEEAEATVK